MAEQWHRNGNGQLLLRTRKAAQLVASFAASGIPAITHGPRAGGQHTVSEWVEIDDLLRIALLYAATATT